LKGAVGAKREVGVTKLADKQGAPQMGHGLPDTIAAAARAVAGAVPVVGSAIGEAIAPFIKGQRQERVEAYLEYLKKRLGELAAKIDASRSEMIEIIEQGVQETLDRARKDRVRQIAHSVAYGIKTDPKSQVNREIVSIVAQLEPEDISLLKAIAARRPDPAFHRAELAHKASWGRLERYSLVDFRQNTSQVPVPSNTGRSGGGMDTISVPTVDTWGQPEGHHSITEMGRAVLVSLGISDVPVPTQPLPFGE
jgi:hypothetical protein